MFVSKEGLSGLDAVRSQRQAVEADAGGVEDSVADGRRDSQHGRLTSACGWNIFPVNQARFNFGHIAEAPNTITREVRICNSAILEFDRFEKRLAHPLNNCGHHLIPQTVALDDG